MIPFGPFEPARADYAGGVTDTALNVVPVADGWGPMPSLTAYSNALPGVCKGAFYVRNNSGVIFIFAGTSTGLYRFNGTTLGWDDITRTTGGAYNVPIDDLWSFATYGNLLLAVNINNEPQVIDVESGTRFANLAGNPPRARYVWVAGDFLVLGNLASAPNKLQWSGLNNATHWIVGEQSSDYQLFPDGQEIQGGITDRLGAFVFQRNAIRYMQIDTTGGYGFTFQAANPTRGVAAPLSIVQIAAQDFVYLSEDGFFRGAEGQAIGAQRVDEWLIGQMIDLDALSAVQGVADPYSKIVWWGFKARSGGSKMLGYQWQLDRWCYSDAPVKPLMSVLTPGIVWDALGAKYSSIDAVTEPFDSRLFKGGRPNFGGFDEGNRLGYFTGTNMAASLETSNLDLAEGQRAFVNGFRVDGDAITLTGSVATQEFDGVPPTWRAAMGPSAITGLVPARANGRTHRFRVDLPSGSQWSRVTGVSPSFKAGGRR